MTSSNNGSLCFSSSLVTPMPISTEYNCAPGFYCPRADPANPISLPQVCPPSIDCQKRRLGGRYCPAQGLYEPIVCPAGSYCPDWRTMHPCPEGSFCIVGSTFARPCPWMSVCPAGTEMRRFYGGLVLVSLLDIATLILFLFHRRWWKPRGDAAARTRLRLKRAACGDIPDSCQVNVMPAPERNGFLSLTDDHQEEASYAMLGGSAASWLAQVEANSEWDDAAPLPSSHLKHARSILMHGFCEANHNLSLDIEFDGLLWHLPTNERTVILDRVSGALRPRRVTAVMGPSGAGKTTFLHVLMGKLAKSGGQLRINGVEDEMNRYKQVLGFVPQEDIMIGELTVRENIYFAARMRLPRLWTPEQVERHVDAVVDVLGLAPVANQLIGSVSDRGISGGQRKRVNIGMELAAAPAALFLDEPTSGLDSSAALEVCQVLRNIADLGLTVVAVIHQPRLEIFRSFDDLLLLEPGGRVAYMGPQRLADRYFQRVGLSVAEGHNPADDILDFTLRTLRWNRSASESRPLVVDMTGNTELGASNSPVHGDIESSQAGSTTRLSDVWSAHGVDILGSMAAETSTEARGSRSDDPSASPSPSTATATTVSAAERQEHYARSRDVVADLAKVRGASFLTQLWLTHERSLRQQSRLVGAYMLEMGVCLVAGSAMGASAGRLSELYKGVLKPPYTLISPAPMETIVPSLGMFVACAIGIAGSPAGVKTFREEMEVYYREAASGHNRLAYYIGKTVSVMYRFALGALHFTAVFHLLGTPFTSFWHMFAIVVLQFYCVYGLAALMSMVVRRENAALLAVIASLVAAILSGYGPSLKQAAEWHMQWVQDLSYARWGSEAFFSWETQPYRSVFLVKEIDAVFWGLTLDRVTLDLSLMFVIGTTYRILAFVLLTQLNKEKQA